MLPACAARSPRPADRGAEASRSRSRSIRSRFRGDVKAPGSVNVVARGRFVEWWSVDRRVGLGPGSGDVRLVEEGVGRGMVPTHRLAAGGLPGGGGPPGGRTGPPGAGGG